MALRKCPDCRFEVSQFAEWCVGCGYRPELKDCSCGDVNKRGSALKSHVANCKDCRGGSKVWDWDD